MPRPKGTFIGEAPPGDGSTHLTANNTSANGILTEIQTPLYSALQ